MWGKLCTHWEAMGLCRFLVFIIVLPGLFGCGKTQSAPNGPNGNTFGYYGGPVISNVRVYAVYWGRDVNSEVEMTMPDFYQALVAGPYMNWLSEYSTPKQTIGRGSYGGAYTLNPINRAVTVKDSDIRTELEAQITAGHLPLPDPSSLYVLDMGSEMTVVMDSKPGTLLTSCVDFCSYHSSYPRSHNAYLAYAVIMDFYQTHCAEKCGAHGGLDDVTTSTSHEVMEAVTDPLGDEGTLPDGTLGVGWFWPNQTNNEGEIADVCTTAPNGHVTGLSGRSYAVQSQWSNSRSSCYSGPP